MHHDGQVIALAISPDGKTIATVGRVTVRFWDAATGQPVGEVLRHTDLVTDAAFGPDGRSIVTANRNYLWSWAAPRPMQEDVERLELWIQVTTGMELDASDAVQYLDESSWRQRYQRLRALGGPPSSGR